VIDESIFIAIDVTTDDVGETDATPVDMIFISCPSTPLGNTYGVTEAGMTISVVVSGIFTVADVVTTFLVMPLLPTFGKFNDSIPNVMFLLPFSITGINAVEPKVATTGYSDCLRSIIHQ
jgi:hypothetical protein